MLYIHCTAYCVNYKDSQQLEYILINKCREIRTHNQLLYVKEG